MNTLPPYPQARLLRADATSVVVTWSFMALAALLWWISAFMLPVLEGATRLALWGMFLAGGVHVVLALLHRCPGCGKHPTIQGFKAPHPASLSQSRAAGVGRGGDERGAQEAFCLHPLRRRIRGLGCPPVSTAGLVSGCQT